MSQPLLSLTGVEVGYGEQKVLAGVDLEVAGGEILGLIGETGSGKTTLCRTVLGLTDLHAGTIRFDGKDIGDLSGSELRRFRHGGAIQFVFQDPLSSLDPDWPIERSVVEPLTLGAPIDSVNTPRQRAEQVFADVGLDPALLDRRPDEVSGGQRQRIVLARALITRPKLLFCDEPVSALDASNRILVLELFKKLRSEHGLSIVFVSHDIGSIAGTSDRLAVLNEGVIVEYGHAADIVRNPSSEYARKLIGAVPTMPGRQFRQAT
ncbi:ABC transporter ATP-binding protein [Mycobacterium sp. C31M]